MTPTKRVIEVLRACAQHAGSLPGPTFNDDVAAALSPTDADLIVQGLDEGRLRVEGTYVWTLDPHQGKAWLVEGNPTRVCWEYLPHMAAYVELLGQAAAPDHLVRFETPESELSLDLAVLNPSGRVVVLGEAKAKPDQLTALLRLIPAFAEIDPGKPAPKSRRGSPQGPTRDAWKLAHQLWVYRPAVLWLVALRDRRVFTINFERGRLELHPADNDTLCQAIPDPVEPHVTPRAIPSPEN